MPDERIENLGMVGLNTDISPTLLPSNALTSLQNVIGNSGALRSIPGEEKLFDLQIAPIWNTVFRDINQIEWAIVSDGLQVHAYSITGQGTGGGPAGVADISPTGGLAAGQKHISFTNHNGILVINSSIDGPHYWPGVANALAKLPGPGDGGAAPAGGWDWTNGWRCQEMRSVRNSLVALGMWEGTPVAARYQHKVRWSTVAAEGELPVIWDPTITSEFAGDDLIGETPGAIVGGALVRDALFIIKEDAVYAMHWTGGFINFQIERLQGGRGTDQNRGFVEVLGSLGIFTGVDLILFDGQSSQSLIEDRVRSKIRGLLSMAGLDKETSTLFFDASKHNLYLLLSSASSRILTDAMVYDVREDHWGHKALGSCYGIAPSSTQINRGDVIDNWYPTTVIDDLPQEPIDTTLYESIGQELILFQANSNNDAWWVSAITNATTNDDGTVKTCEAQRIDIPLNGVRGLAMVTEVRPEVSGQLNDALLAEQPIQFRFGSRDNLSSPIVWGAWHDVYLQQTLQLTPRVTGRFISWHARSAAIGSWSLAALNIHWESAGEYIV